MPTKIFTGSGTYDLSNIKNAKDLREEIAFLKMSIDKGEEELGDRFSSMPKHFLKSTADNVLPSFLNKLLANGSWKLLLSAAAMFANPFSRKFGLKRNIVGTAKKLGLIALLKTAYNIWMQKQAQGRTKAGSQPKKAAVTTLKTNNFKKD